MKTKKSMKNRTCYQCDVDICKGEQYGQRSISAGKTCSWSADQRPTEEIPAWAWSDHRVKVNICNKCANPSEVAA